MIVSEIYLKEMNEEAVTTRKFMAVVPTDKLDWKPHKKSMTMRVLATHIAELPKWVALAMTTDELDFATSPYVPTTINSTTALQELFEKSISVARSYLSPEYEGKLAEPWTLRSGETVFSTNTRCETIRHAFNQIIHYRGQLSVYLRLLDIKVPPTYDEVPIIIESN